MRPRRGEKQKGSLRFGGVTLKGVAEKGRRNILQITNDEEPKNQSVYIAMDSVQPSSRHQAGMPVNSTECKTSLIVSWRVRCVSSDVSNRSDPI